MSMPSSRSTSCGVMWPFSSSSGTVSTNVSLPWSRTTSVTGSSWERNSTNSVMPPSWRNFSSTGVSPRRSRMTSSRPGTMNDVWRARPSSPSISNVASLVKIWRSGQKRMRVPDLFLPTRPPLRESPDFGVKPAAGPSVSKTPGAPRRKLMPWADGDRSTSMSIRADNALTTDRPTPCRPPVATYEPPPNLPPACSLVATTSTPGSPVLGSLSVGIPRPSSCTSADPSGWRVTCTVCAAPASASSTPLSMISHRHCMRPRVSVEPMYMPGRLRTASSPSRTRR